VHIRTLKMTDDVLSVRYSPNGKLLAVSLLDSTVKVFYQDTLKFFLSLYGHKVGIQTRSNYSLLIFFGSFLCFPWTSHTTRNSS
jgi:WD40 repeat protein